MTTLSKAVLLLIISTGCSLGLVSGFAPPNRPLALATTTTSSGSQSSLALNAKSKKKKADDGFIEPLIKMAFPGAGTAKSNPLETSVETALLLMDKKRQAEFKKDMVQQFPFVPPGVMDVCVDSLADAFTAVAPSKLKTALKPGGLEKVRPELEETIVASLQQQSMVKDLPLPKSDKTKLLQYLVKISLDYLLEDVQDMLKEPTERLRLMEEQKYQIQRYMSVWQLTWYRIRYYPIQMAFIGTATVLSSLFLYQQYQKTLLAKQVTALCLSVVAAVKTPLATIKAFAVTAWSTLITQLKQMGVLKTAKKQMRRR